MLFAPLQQYEASYNLNLELLRQVEINQRFHKLFQSMVVHLPEEVYAGPLVTLVCVPSCACKLECAEEGCVPICARVYMHTHGRAERGRVCLYVAVSQLYLTKEPVCALQSVYYMSICQRQVEYPGGGSVLTS